MKNRFLWGRCGRILYTFPLFFVCPFTKNNFRNYFYNYEKKTRIILNKNTCTTAARHDRQNKTRENQKRENLQIFIQKQIYLIKFIIQRAPCEGVRQISRPTDEDKGKRVTDILVTCNENHS